MTWIFIGFLMVVGTEMLIRVLKGNEREEQREIKATKITFPWYGWGLFAYGILKRGKRK